MHPLHKIFVVSALLGLVVCAAPRATAAAPPQKAFPEAQGFGAETLGGHGGRVCVVTTLRDSGAGSLRDCVTKSGKRIVTFSIGGVITLSSTLFIREPYLTIAGQTAPSPVVLRNHEGMTDPTVWVQTHDVVVRGLAIRPGPTKKGNNNLSAVRHQGFNIIYDHVSFGWSTDEIVALWGDVKDITIQHSLIAEGLYGIPYPKKADQKFGYGFGLLAGGGATNITLYRNVFAHNWDRNPRIASGNVDVVNNVIYNYQIFASDLGNFDGPAKINYINNYIKKGQNSRNDRSPVRIGARGVAYVSPGNRIVDTHGEVSASVLGDEFAERGVAAAFRDGRPTLPLMTAERAFTDVLSHAGASIGLTCDGQLYLRRDAVDSAIIDDVRQGTGKIIRVPSEGTPRGARTQATTPSACADGDSDGLPDAWEQRYFARKDAQRNQDSDKDGYANIEEYINGTNPLQR